MELSFTEENYLKAIYHLSGGGLEDVSTNTLADEMQTRPASVSDMIKKLNQKKVITYQKYQGVNVSEEGKMAALKVIRKHRLWEVFLVKELNFSWAEVHDVAEQLEHIRSPLLIRRLDEYLGYPKFDPHGDPIPDENGFISEAEQHPLHEMNLNEEYTLVSVKNDSSDFLKYLGKIKAKLGTKIVILERIEFDQSMEISVDGRPQFISREVSENLYVSRS
jgi:DtxR family Mn-dependent transcriptional regulator